MIQQPHIDDLQCFFQALRQCNIGLAGLWIAAGMVVGDDDGCSVGIEHGLDDLARVDAGGIQSAVKQPLEAQVGQN